MTGSATSSMGAILGQLCQRGAHSTGAGNADVDLAVGLAGAVECTSHEGIVLGCVTEHHQLAAPMHWRSAVSSLAFFWLRPSA